MVSEFFSGSLDPRWPHAILLSVAIIASFAVAVGIVMESPHWSIANALVIGGVVLEAICTLLIFGFDEGISSRQQSFIEVQNSQILAVLSELCDQDNSLIGNPACIEFRKQQRDKAAAKEKAAKQ
jgi:hypothetical protein